MSDRTRAALALSVLVVASGLALTFVGTLGPDADGASHTAAPSSHPADAATASSPPPDRPDTRDLGLAVDHPLIGVDDSGFVRWTASGLESLPLAGADSPDPSSCTAVAARARAPGDEHIVAAACAPPEGDGTTIVLLRLT